MSTSMVERIAAVLMEMDGSHDIYRYVDSAYVILREIREPTQSMVAAGNVSSWQSMIDAALAEPIRN